MSGFLTLDSGCGRRRLGYSPTGQSGPSYPGSTSLIHPVVKKNSHSSGLTEEARRTDERMGLGDRGQGCSAVQTGKQSLGRHRLAGYFFFFLRFIYFSLWCVSTAYKSVCCVCVCCPQRPEDSTGSLELSNSLVCAGN